MAFSLPGGVISTTDTYQTISCNQGRKFAIQVIGNNPVDVGLGKGDLRSSRDIRYTQDAVVQGQSSWNDIVPVDEIRFKSHNPGFPSDISITVFSTNDIGGDLVVGSLGNPLAPRDQTEFVSNFTVSSSIVGPFDVSLFDTIAIPISFSGLSAVQQIEFTVNWFGKDGTLVGTRKVMVEKADASGVFVALSNRGKILFKNQGPFVVVSWVVKSGVGSVNVGPITGMARVFPWEFDPQGGSGAYDLISIDNVSIPASTNYFRNAVLWSGPVQVVLVVSGPGNTQINFEYLEGVTPSWKRIYTLDIASAGGIIESNFEVWWPPTAVRAHVISGVGNTVDLHCLPMTAG